MAHTGGMSVTEQRELDAWIAERVMGWIPTFKDCGKSPSGCETLFPHYTTDPAAAMEVLKKCAEKCSLAGMEFVIVRGFDWRVCAEPQRGISTFAETLELAICKFAKKLWEGK